MTGVSIAPSLRSMPDFINYSKRGLNKRTIVKEYQVSGRYLSHQAASINNKRVIATVSQ